MRESKGRGRDSGVAIPTLACLCVACWLPIAGCGGAPPSPQRPNILLITVDTLRADAVDLAGAAGAAASRTPQIARLASEATVFERAIAPMALTRPSHFSIFTGRYPREHGVVNNQFALPDAETTVAEALRDAGYATGAFVAVDLLGADSGAGQGFEVLVSPRGRREWRAPQVVDRALAWLARQPEDRPFFAWVHLFDPHQPYDPPADLRSHLDPELAARYPVLGWREFLEIAQANGGRISQAVVAHARALYAAEVAGVDREVGRLIEGVDAQRAEEDAMVVFTADHGECFENGIYFEHSDCLFEGGIRVPLIVRHAPRFPPGARVPDLVSNADIAPTLVRAAGLEPPAAMSVPPLQPAAGNADREVLLQNPFYPEGVLPARRHRQVVIRRIAGAPVAPFEAGRPKLGIVRGSWKYLRSGEVEELYASGVASGAERNVVLQQRGVRDEMRAALDRALERHPQAAIEAGEINPELLQSLRALGYLE